MAAPDLLGEDGSASIATALMMSHHGLRRDLARFRNALRDLRPDDRDQAAALRDEWKSYQLVLHGHHDAEDQRMFPHMRSQLPSLAATIDRLTADHRLIDPLLARGDRAFANPASGEAAAVVAELFALLDPHLALEEAEIVPHLRAAKEFPAPATAEEADLFAQGFAWSSHGIAPEVLAKVGDMLPEAIRARLPAAREAFDARSLRVWGPDARPGASTTPVPDWLTGGSTIRARNPG